MITHYQVPSAESHVHGLHSFIHVGRRIAHPKVDPKTDDRKDPRTLFNSGIPTDLIKQIRGSRRQVTYAEMQAAWKQSIWKDMKVIFEDVKLLTCDSDLFACALPHIKTDTVSYVQEYFVCRNYATAFNGIVDGVLGVGTVGKTLDFAGHHSYNVVILDYEGELKVYGVEPQTDQLILRLNPEKHYTGTGIAIIGG